MRATKGKLDILTMAKHDLETLLQKKQEECRVLHGELQGSKELQGALRNELEALKKELTRQIGLVQEHEKEVARLPKVNGDVSTQLS